MSHGRIFLQYQVPLSNALKSVRARVLWTRTCLHSATKFTSDGDFWLSWCSNNVQFKEIETFNLCVPLILILGLNL